MDLFISWSGPRSRAAAEALREWLPKLINAVHPWLSCADIDKGARWSSEIATRLADATAGILCLTPANIHSDWIIFEAGALAKTVTKTHVCPLLFDLEPADIAGPLAQFQATRATVDEMRALLATINRALGAGALGEDLLTAVFNKWWPELEQQFAQLPPDTPSAPLPERTDRAILEEILALVRSSAGSVSYSGGTDLDTSKVCNLVMLVAKQLSIPIASIMPVYSRMPPPPGEPHFVRVRTRTGRSYAVRTPMELGPKTIEWMVRADLQDQLEHEQDAVARSVKRNAGTDSASPPQTEPAGP